MMNRKEFMRQLELLLSDISEDERREALDYYESYFDEAGEAEEASVIQKLGSPGKVAAIIKADLRENGGDAQEYREGNYEEQTAEGQERQYADRRERGYRPREKKGRGKLTLLIILLIFLSPFFAGTAGGILGVIVTIIFLPFLLAFGIGAGVICLLIGGIFLVVSGIGLWGSYAAGGVLSIGIGFILTAIGLVGLVFVVWAAANLIPRFLRWFTDWCHRILHRERKDGKKI